jgi:uncharacterized protein YuzE
MSVRIGDQEFEHAIYDEEGDVLYLRNGEPVEAALTQGTAEGHAVRFDDEGNVIGMTIVNAGWLASHEEEIAISFPQKQITVPAGDVATALEHSVSQ